MTRGKYIVLEGPEGVGKTTQIQELGRRLQAAGLPVRMLREPDSQSDLTARAIRQLTQDPRYPMNTRTEVLLYNAARSQSLNVIKNSVESGVYCIVDRNYLTTLAIQYYGRGDVPDYDTITSIINFAVGGIEPDLCVILDAPVLTLKERAAHRGAGERFDNLDDAFLERVRAGYLWEAKQRDLPIVFATDDEQTVAENIWKLVAETLKSRDGSKAAHTAPATSVAEIIEQKQAAPHEPPAPEAAAPDPKKSAPYYTPETLNKKTAGVYKQAMDKALSAHKKLAASLPPEQKALADLALPVAACFEDEMVRQDTVFKQPLVKISALKELTNNYDSGTVSIAKLVDYWPRNEFAALPSLLFPYTTGSLEQLNKETTNWSYDQKARALQETLASTDNVGLNAVQYTWDVLTDYATLLELRRRGYGRNSHQPLTPRYGFAVPEAIETAGKSEQFEACFDASLELHSKLQAAGFEQEAQYATLLGHNVRSAITLSARALSQLMADASLPESLSTLIRDMADQVTEVHPLLATAKPVRV